MKRVAAYLVLCLTTACVAPAIRPEADTDAVRPAQSGPERLAAGGVCRIGPDGGPVLADRGIGGTGASARAPELPQVADRGIGGTGIVGIVTGFASICVNGLEVSYDDSAVINIEGVVQPASLLRVGQVVVIEAQGPEAAPHARTISVRREITGRVESVERGGDTLIIAGQSVLVPPGTWGADRFRPGDGVAVSGLRRGDGIIVASRLDRAPADMFVARGQVVRDAASVRIGRLVLEAAFAANLSQGQFVTVAGDYRAGRGYTTAVTSDTLFAGMADTFETPVNRLMVQAFVHVVNGTVWLNGRKINTDPGLPAHPDGDGIAIVSMQREPDGSYKAVGLRFAGYEGLAADTSRRAGDTARVVSLPSPSHGRDVTRSTPAQSGQTSSPPTASRPADPTAAPRSVGVDTNPASPPPALPAVSPDQVASPVSTPSAASEVPAEPVMPVQPAVPTATGGSTLESVPPDATSSPTSQVISSGGPAAGSTGVGSGPTLPKAGSVLRASSAAPTPRPGGSALPPTISLVTGAVGPATPSAAVGAVTPDSPPISSSKPARRARTTGTHIGKTPVVGGGQPNEH